MSIFRFVILSAARDLLSYAALLPLHHVKQVPCALCWRNWRHLDRVLDHKNNVNDGFTSKYRCHRLVYFESFKYVGNAIAREKKIKGWLRSKKVALIRAENPTWEDLSGG